MKTEMLYLNDPAQLHAEVRIFAISDQDGAVAVATDVTPFYAKGGGQPADSGWFQLPEGRRIDVLNVIRDGDGIVWHVVDGPDPEICAGATIEAKVNPSSRYYHSQLHSAGEAVAAAVHFAGYAHWSVETACHFPGQCRVVFNDRGTPSDLEVAATAIAAQLEEMVQDDLPIRLAYAEDLDELNALHRLEEGKHFAEWPVRLVSPKDGFWRPCMGTHVDRLSDIGTIMLRKVKRKKGAIAVGYDIN